jgi:hypothetical protein
MCTLWETFVHFSVVHKRTDPEAASGDIHNPRGGLRRPFPPCVGKSRRVGGVACGQPPEESPDLLGEILRLQGEPMQVFWFFGPRPNWIEVLANHAKTRGEVLAQRRTSRANRLSSRMASQEANRSTLITTIGRLSGEPTKNHER